METLQERELQEYAWWPLDAMSCRSLDTSSSNGCSFLFGWDPQLRYFGLGVVGVAAAGDHRTALEHELQLLFPKRMESPGSSEASTAVTCLPAAQEDATVIAEDPLDELLRNFWDAELKELLCFTPSFIPEESTTIGCFLADDGLLAVSSTSLAWPTLPEETVALAHPAELLPPSSPSSHFAVEPQAGDAGGAGQDQRRINCSSKRPVDNTDAWSRSSSKRNKKPPPLPLSSAAGPSVVRPFTVVKPCGADGVATLADINERILTRPTRPVHHPVGEFACAPRTSAGGDRRPSPSGKMVTGFTRLHTAGKGTITVIRTTG